jgi:hypothetical protein
MTYTHIYIIMAVCMYAYAHTYICMADLTAFFSVKKTYLYATLRTKTESVHYLNLGAEYVITYEQKDDKNTQQEHSAHTGPRWSVALVVSLLGFN